MGFPVHSLVAKGGEIYCHVFENPRTGLARDVFWSITVEFQPIRYGDEEWDCSMTCEWIRWPIRSWRELDGRHLDVDYGQDGVEASLYLAEHHTGSHTQLAIHHRKGNLFRVEMAMVVDFGGVLGDDQDPALPVQGVADVPFTGLLVVPKNLVPTPQNEEEIQQVVQGFVNLAEFGPPEPQGHGFVLRPAT